MHPWWIGCSGFHYSEWKEVFYPAALPQKKWFDFYCEHFHTLELNSTFYRFPQLKFLENWYKKSPADFCFSVKVPKAITHFKQFNETDRMLGDFYRTTREGLADKLGAILFQMPARYTFSEERLQRMIESVDPSFANVLEFRHESWWQTKVYKTLAKNKISFCSISYPGLPDTVIESVPVIYYRFHGVPVLYKSTYEKKVLEKIGSQIVESGKKQVFIYFNNTWGTAALVNARQMESIYDQKKKRSVLINNRLYKKGPVK